jgi:hypothetical protein
MELRMSANERDACDVLGRVKRGELTVVVAAEVLGKSLRQMRRTWMMVQMDGSHHDWFEGRAPKCVLMVIIDDASNVTFARFSCRRRRGCDSCFSQIKFKLNHEATKITKRLSLDSHPAAYPKQTRFRAWENRFMLFVASWLISS